MTTNELRQKFLNFFKEKNHAIISSASLIPENDPTVLFTTAGMHPLVPYLLGEKHPEGKRLADVQKCVRTVDIDEVGDASHLTFFEMLGNWSLGDYFKEQAIKWSWEFLTSEKWLNLDKNKLAVSVFAGDKDAPFDEQAYNFWLEVGLPENRIAKLPKKNNWWGPAGQTGPCGPDTEIFYWAGETDLPPTDSNPQTDEDNWLEIWNNVFMQYFKDKTGKFTELQQKNVDTGMGLERTIAILNGWTDVYLVDTLYPLIQKLERLSGLNYQQVSVEEKKSLRIIVDHVRAAVMIMGDDRGIAPSNVDQGYVVRKLIRRAIRHASLLNIKDNFTVELAKKVLEIFKDVYPELARNELFVISELKKEEVKFRKTLEQGIKEFNKLLAGFKTAEEKTGRKIETISGKQAFKLYDTYGFPLEMTEELAEENNLKVDKIGFEQAFLKHQEKSRQGAEQKFKGGLADHSEMSKKYHTATHLLHAGLRKVLGEHVAQKGSNINEKRLRFDFSHPQKLTPEERAQVEDYVNKAIEADLPVSYTEMTVEEAKKQGAIGLFTHKYGEKVKVYTIGEGNNVVSKEICGGPHVDRTGVLGHFKIKKEESSSAGVRRIKAVLE